MRTLNQSQQYLSPTEQAEKVCPSRVSCQHPPLLTLQRPGPLAAHRDIRCTEVPNIQKRLLSSQFYPQKTIKKLRTETHEST